MQEVTSVQQYLDTLKDRFRPEGAKGVQGVFQFNLTGDGATTFHVVVSDGTMSLGMGAHTSPNVTLTMNAPDYLRMVNGTLSGQRAYITGKLKVSGNIPLAMKMEKILPPRS